MNYIELESVGSTITNEGMVFPIDISEPPVTASDADEMMGVHIMDTADEWWANMSCQDCVTLFSFLANTDIYLTEGYMTWAVGMGDVVAKHNGYNTLAVAAITEGWSIDDYLWKSTEKEVA
jgi:hypothetical protein|tara:strand:- start:68 stop:430 length:363 start_codon:yes stop_codon:yes gene_type:complete